MSRGSSYRTGRLRVIGTGQDANGFRYDICHVTGYRWLVWRQGEAWTIRSELGRTVPPDGHVGRRLITAALDHTAKKVPDRQQSFVDTSGRSCDT